MSESMPIARLQEELADHLAAMQCCLVSTPAALENTLRTMDLASLVPYTGTVPGGIAADIDRLMGFDRSI